MLKHTRVTGIPDVQRIGAAIARPGNDPRLWVSFATVDAVGVDSEGAFVDCTCLPTGDPVTARVGALYAGPGFGFYVPISVGDEVVVVLPNGDPLHGGVVVARLQSPSDELSAEAQANPTDAVLVIEEGKSIRIAVSGGGKVYLGSADASRGVARLADDINVDLTSLQTCLDLRYVQIPFAPPLVTPVTGSITSASDTVVSK